MSARWTEAADIAAQRDDHDRAQNDERWTDRNAAWREIYDDRQPGVGELADGFDEAMLCSRCEFGHGGVVCRWCMAEGRAS